MNFVVHLFSGIGFVVLIYLFLASRKRHRLVIEYVRLTHKTTEKKALAQQPVVFLKQFSEAFDIPFANTAKSSSALAKINLQPWVIAHLNGGIKSISCHPHTDHIQVTVEFINNNEVSKLNANELKTSLGDRAEIKLT